MSMFDFPPPTGPAVSPAPTEEEAIAIMAAMEALWPRPVAAPVAEAMPSRAWRFSGRWWAPPVAARRQRPHR